VTSINTIRFYPGTTIYEYPLSEKHEAPVPLIKGFFTSQDRQEAFIVTGMHDF